VGEGLLFLCVDLHACADGERGVPAGDCEFDRCAADPFESTVSSSEMKPDSLDLPRLPAENGCEAHSDT
jgi:hypothetical protein